MLRKWLFRHGSGRGEAVLSVSPICLRLTGNVTKPAIPSLMDEHARWMKKHSVVWRFETIDGIDHYVAFLRKQDAALFMMFHDAHPIHNYFPS